MTSPITIIDAAFAGQVYFPAQIFGGSDMFFCAEREIEREARTSRRATRDSGSPGFPSTRDALNGAELICANCESVEEFCQKWDWLEKSHATITTSAAAWVPGAIRAILAAAEPINAC